MDKDGGRAADSRQFFNETIRRNHIPKEGFNVAHAHEFIPSFSTSDDGLLLAEEIFRRMKPAIQKK